MPTSTNYFPACRAERSVWWAVAHLVDVARVKADGVPRLCASVPESQELVGDLHTGINHLSIGSHGNSQCTCRNKMPLSWPTCP